MSNQKHPTVDVVVAAGESWLGIVRRGQTLRIVDVKGNQAVSTLFYNANDTHEHYSAQDTIRQQQNIYLSSGTQLMSNRGRPMLRLVEDGGGRHDTLGGACSAESNSVCYGLDTRAMHNCRDSFLLALAQHDEGLTKRDLPSNVNFFLSIPVAPEGTLGAAAARSTAGAHVQLAALIDLLVLIANCPQLNDASTAHDPTPIRVMAWDTA